MYFDIDREFQEYFRNLKQEFLYVTDECNIRCVQCLYKPSLTFHPVKEIGLETAVALASDFRELGAMKLTILGGEPTLYGLRERSEPLFRLVKDIKDLGYEYVRLDTNGQFGTGLLSNRDFRRLDEIAFSFDGFSAKMNDSIRGRNTFERAVHNTREAVRRGYRVTITCCLHASLLQRDHDGNLLLDRMIRFGESLGIDQINFHDLFKVGVPMDTWTGDLNPNEHQWIEAYREIRRGIEVGKYGVSVRLPQCFVRIDEFKRNPDYYGYCPVKLGERVMAHPNGMIRICSNLICTSYGIAKYYGRKIVWDRSGTNEAFYHDCARNTPCTNRSKGKSYGELVPLCFSFKPGQDEIVWKKLQWEMRRRKAEPCQIVA